MWKGQGVHQLEPPSPIQAFGANPFRLHFKIERLPEEVLRADVLRQTADSKRIHAIRAHYKKKIGSTYKSTQGLTQEINGDGGSI